MCNPGDDLVLAAATIAISISKGKSATEVNILAVLFSAIADNLAIIAAKQQECETQ
ncbi:DUF6774 domain-containing protein [Faecalispora anaeroviscerum]|uniref:DUF6774 domain-containing protein n=1 Tax=Faecalispora anaeroviscerum TaxID=2991836 RepID=UPI0024BAE3B7|nr:DUF6774 domain-containing protein [Faecalispora anaeroviscerum]